MNEKFKLNNNISLNAGETFQITKIKRISDTNANKSIGCVSAENDFNTNKNKEISKGNCENYIFTKNSHTNIRDLNSIKNIDLGDRRDANNSFFDNEENDRIKDNQDNPLMNLSDKNFNIMNNSSKSKWNFDKNLLDDSEFRKTHIIKEKLDIEYPDKPVNNINLNKIRSVKKSDNSEKIYSPNNAIHRKVNSIILIENKENDTIRDLANAMNIEWNKNLNITPDRDFNQVCDPKEVIIIYKIIDRKDRKVFRGSQS